MSFVRPFNPPEGYFSVFQMLSVIVKGDYRDDLIDYLKQNEISSKIYFDPVHKENYYKQLPEYKDVKLQFTEKISKQVLSLPFHPNISTNQIGRIIETLKNFEEKFVTE